jgi:hypothetical protein
LRLGRTKTRWKSKIGVERGSPFRSSIRQDRCHYQPFWTTLLSSKSVSRSSSPLPSSDLAKRRYGPDPCPIFFHLHDTYCLIAPFHCNTWSILRTPPFDRIIQVSSIPGLAPFATPSNPKASRERPLPSHPRKAAPFLPRNSHFARWYSRAASLTSRYVVVPPLTVPWPIKPATSA